MSPAPLVGTAGVLSGFSGINTALTLAWGTGETCTAGNLLLCWVFGAPQPTLPAAPTGWSIAKQQAGDNCSISLFYKIATGGDAAPTIAAIAATNMQGQLAEFVCSAPLPVLDQVASAASLTSPITVTTPAVDIASGDLMVFCSAVHYSTSQTDTLTNTLNNGATANETNSNSAVAGNHVDFGWGVTTGNSTADSTSFAFPTTSIAGKAPVLLTSFRLTGGPLLTPTAATTVQAAVFLSAVPFFSLASQVKTQAIATISVNTVKFLTPTAQSTSQAIATALPILIPVAQASTQATVTVIAQGIQPLLPLASATARATMALSANANVVATASLISQASATIFVISTRFISPTASIVSQASVTILPGISVRISLSAQALTYTKNVVSIPQTYEYNVKGYTHVSTLGGFDSQLGNIALAFDGGDNVVVTWIGMATQYHGTEKFIFETDEGGHPITLLRNQPTALTHSQMQQVMKAGAVLLVLDNVSGGGGGIVGAPVPTPVLLRSVRAKAVSSATFVLWPPPLWTFLGAQAASSATLSLKTAKKLTPSAQATTRATVTVTGGVSINLPTSDPALPSQFSRYFYGPDPLEPTTYPVGRNPFYRFKMMYLQHSSLSTLALRTAKDQQRVANIKAENPTCQVYCYHDPTSSTQPPGLGGVLNNGADPTTANANESWFLHSATPISPANRIQWTNYAGNYFMNVGNPSYWDELVSHSGGLALAGGFDGVYWDNNSSIMISQGMTNHGITCVEYANDAAWQVAFGNMVANVYPRINAMGLKNFGNVITFQGPSPGLWATWGQYMDGAMEQAFTDTGAGIANTMPYYWTAFLNNMIWSEANGKQYMAVSKNKTEAGMYYALVAGLLVSNGNILHCTQRGDVQSSDDWYGPTTNCYDKAIALGHATAPYVKSGNLLTRTFTGGNIALNIGNAAIVVPATGLSLPAYTGIIN